MECKAARLLLSFPATGPDAPTGPEAAALRDHLAVCPDCDASARAEARLDAHLGRAVRDVPVPSGLKSQLLARLAADRADAWRKSLFRAARVAAAAGVLLGVGVGLWLWTRHQPIDANDIHIAWNVARPTNAETVEAEFRAMGYRDCAPDFVNFAYPCMVGEGPVPGHPGRKAPRMMFAGARGEHAVLIAVPRYQLTQGYDPEPGYRYRVEVVRPAGRWAYLVLYTGNNWDWLHAPAE